MPNPEDAFRPPTLEGKLAHNQEAADYMHAVLELARERGAPDTPGSEPNFYAVARALAEYGLQATDKTVRSWLRDRYAQS